MPSRKRHNPSPRRDRFARLYAAELHRAGERALLQYDPETFSLVRPGPCPKVTNLGNIYAEYLQAPRSDRDDLLRRRVQFSMDPQAKVPAEYADARPDILPRARTRSHHSLIELQFRVHGAAPRPEPVHPFAEELAIELVYDLPDSTCSVNATNFSRWGVPFDQALRDALRNLSEMSREGLKPHSPGVWRSPWSDDHDAARILLTELIEPLPVRGEPVAAIPNRSTLLVTGSEDPDGLRRLAQATKREFAEPNPITAIPFRLSCGTWSPFLPSPGHPHHEPFRELWLSSQADDYARQTQSLRRLRDREGERVWVSEFQLAEGEETGRLTSVCLWPLGTEILVPQTEVVAIVRPNGDLSKGEVVASVSWEDVRQALGDRLEQTDLIPPRFRVRGGLNERDVEAAGARNPSDDSSHRPVSTGFADSGC